MLCKHPNKIGDTYCEDCTFSEPMCSECFLSEHRRHPFHWAWKWEGNSDHGTRVDISKVVAGDAIPLGHGGLRCPRKEEALGKGVYDGVTFTVVAPNGIHGTVLEFCECDGKIIDRPLQLMRAKMFPSTMNTPATAFTHPLLRSYRSLSFRTKCSGHDFIGALQRLTDNVRPWSVQVSFQPLHLSLRSQRLTLRQFPLPSLLLVSRVWSYLQTRMNSGITHSATETYFSSRKDDMKIYCMACPYVGVNITTLEIRFTPASLKHVISLQMTLDGNFQLNRFAKKTRGEADENSLWDGNGYSPAAADLKEYLKRTSSDAVEVRVLLIAPLVL